jgi:hypothetical protein
MTPGSRRVLRDNAFIVAAASLPLIVVVFFVLASAIPRWIVPPPAYDLVLRATDPYRQTTPSVAIDFKVRDGKVEATARPALPNTYTPRATLFLFDHMTMRVREVPVDLPDQLAEGDPPRTVVVDAFGDRKISPEPQAPDGYRVETRSQNGGGIVGDLFGMRRYGAQPAIVKSGRVIAIELPPPFADSYSSSASAIGWLTGDGQR